MDADREPWEQLDAETARAYSAFRTFRDLGPTRTLLAMFELGQASRPAIRGWSLRFRWAERARAWDSETYRLEDARRLEAIRTMGQTHQQIARAMIAAAVRSMRADHELTPHQAARFVEIGTRLERAALTGDHLPPPTPVVEPDELSPLERIARELAGIA